MLLKKRVWIFVVILAFSSLFTIILAAAPKTKEEVGLIIYDVHADSPRIVKDDGSIEFSDYVRIKNLTDRPYDLTGLFLSDRRANHQKLPLDGVVIEANDSVMIRLDPSWNFALKRDGSESVYLSDERGNVLFRYEPDMKPPMPVLSADSGFYDEEFALSMSVEGDYSIFYTLDGSIPDEGSQRFTEPIRVYDRSPEPNEVVSIPNTIRYYLDSPNDPIIETPVDKAFTVRAVAIDGYGNKSDIVSREYFFCGDKYRNVLSIIADPKDLFGDYGIASVGREYDEWYLNGMEGEEPSVIYKNKGREWEIPASFDYFRDGNMVFAQNCGLRVQGRSTRFRRIKNFQVIARNCYSGSDVFEYDFFEGEKYRCDRLNLDDSFRESFFLTLIKDENIIKQRTTDRVALFINGEFWNDVYIRQRIDKKYYLDHYGIPEENLIVLDESFPEIGAEDDETFDEVRAPYLALLDYCRENDISDKANYEYLQSMMDMDTYVDYLALNTWVGCNDWGEFENDTVWRVKEPDGSGYGDGRYRWEIHDGDDVFNRDNILPTKIEFIQKSSLYNGLMKNTDFRKKFEDRIIELSNTTFSENRVNEELSTGNWKDDEVKFIKDFFVDRKEVMEKMIEEGNYW